MDRRAPAHPPAGVSLGGPGDAWLIELYLEHRDAMYRTAQRMLHGAAVGGVSADDVVQQVIFELHERGLPPDRADAAAAGPRRAYLLRACRSRAIDAIRRARRLEPLDPERLDPPDPAAQAALEAVELESLLRRCEELLPRLTSKERFAFEERVRRQRPAKEVAEKLDVSPPRVSQLVRAATAKLLKGLEEDGHAR